MAASSNIVTSVILSANPQADGRTQVQEQHTDVVGLTYQISYLAAADADLNAALAVHAQSLSEQLMNGEIGSNTATILAQGGAAATPGALTFNYSSEGELFNAMAIEAGMAPPLQVLMFGQYLNVLNTLSPSTLTGTIGMSAGNVSQLQSLASQFQTLLAQFTALIQTVAADILNGG